MTDTTALTNAQNILKVTLAALPPNSNTPPVGPLPYPFVPIVASDGDTTISPEMTFQYRSQLTLAGYQYRI